LWIEEAGRPQTREKRIAIAIQVAFRARERLRLKADLDEDVLADFSIRAFSAIHSSRPPVPAMKERTSPPANPHGEKSEMKSRSILLVLVCGFLAQPVVFAQGNSDAAQSQNATLYQRLGGYNALAAVTDDFIARLAGDPQLGRFFIGFSNDSKVRIRQHIVDFLCQATGGPCKYTGRDMKTSHTGLNITEADWNTTVKHLIATLDKFKVPDKEKNEVLQAIAAQKGDIVGR
jgi:hemoglobin